MSGVKGRSGRRPMPVSLHVMRGTYRADRHGPRPTPVMAGAVAPQLDVPPVPKTVLAGLGAPGREAVCDLWCRYGDWTPAQLLILHQIGLVQDALAEYAAIIAQDGRFVTPANETLRPPSLFRETLSTPRPDRIPHPLARLQAQAQRTLVLLLRQLDLKEG